MLLCIFQAYSSTSVQILEPLSEIVGHVMKNSEHFITLPIISRKQKQQTFSVVFLA